MCNTAGLYSLGSLSFDVLQDKDKIDRVKLMKDVAMALLRLRTIQECKMALMGVVDICAPLVNETTISEYLKSYSEDPDSAETEYLSGELANEYDIYWARGLYGPDLAVIGPSAAAAWPVLVQGLNYIKTPNRPQWLDFVTQVKWFVAYSGMDYEGEVGYRVSSSGGSYGMRLPIYESMVDPGDIKDRYKSIMAIALDARSKKDEIPTVSVSVDSIFPHLFTEGDSNENVEERPGSKSRARQ